MGKRVSSEKATLDFSIAALIDYTYCGQKIDSLSSDVGKRSTPTGYGTFALSRIVNATVSLIVGREGLIRL